MKVDFVISGTQKGGTTALDFYLRNHPQICMAKIKEVHFFDNEERFKDGHPDYDLYHSAFEPNPSHKLLGETTPIYMYWHDAPKRIWQYNPGMKHIVLLRNPIDRAYSHWNMERSRSADALSFWNAIRLEAQRCREVLPLQHRVYSYLDRGFYSEQLRRLWMFFSQEQVLVLRNEDLKMKLNDTLRKVSDFLEIDEFMNVEPMDVHSRPYQAPMSPQEKEFLHTVFEYEIRLLERMLGWDCSHWLPIREEEGVC